MNEQVFTEHRAALRAFAQKLSANSADADDLVSATFEALPGALSQYQGRSDIRSFLLGVCANVWRRMKRSTMRREQVHGAFEAIAPVEAPDLESHVAAGQLAQKLSCALQTLPEAQRVAFMLVAIEERQVREVAQLCGVPEATVRSRVFHARRKLQAELVASTRSMAHVAFVWVLIALVVISGCAGIVASPVGRPLRLWLNEKLELHRKKRHSGSTSMEKPRIVQGLTPPPEEVQTTAIQPVDDAQGSAAFTAPRAGSSLSSTNAGSSDGALLWCGGAGASLPKSRDRASTARTRDHALAPTSTGKSIVSAPFEPAVASDSPEEEGKLPAGTVNQASAHVPAWDASVELFAKAHRLYLEEARYDDALRAWDAYLRDYPQGSLIRDARFNRALTLVHARRYAEAREALATFASGRENGFKQAEARVLLQAIEGLAR